MAITAIFDKVRWIKGEWGSKKVEADHGSFHGRSRKPVYRSVLGSSTFDTKVCVGMCAEGAIELDLGMERHDGDPYDYAKFYEEGRAKDWLLGGNWFRGLLYQVGKDYSNKFLRKYALNQYEYHSSYGSSQDALYWSQIVNVEQIPDFNDHLDTKEEDVRDFLEELEKTNIYNNIQRLCRLSDKELEVFKQGYIKRLRNEGNSYSNISGFTSYTHYNQLRNANVI